MITKLLYLFGFLIPALGCFSQAGDWNTYYEKSGFIATPRYDETVKFCQALDQASEFVHYEGFGVSPQGRELPLLIMDRNGNFDPAAVQRSGNAVVLIQACIHAGESEGKDAGLTLIRDLVILKKYGGIPEHLTILFIPVFNVDGHERFGAFNRINQNGPVEMGWRVTAQNLNLNRDFLKADAPEMQAWLKLFNRWVPDFIVDCHTTDGADYQYSITYGMEVLGNMDRELTAWQKDVFLKGLDSRMNQAGYPMIPYVNFRKWHDPRSGLVAGVSPPILSTGYTAARNRPGLLIETHMLKDYKTRVTATFEMLKISLDIVNSEHVQLRKLVRDADKYCSSPEFRKEKLPLDFEASMKDSIMLDFRGVEYSAEKSDLTGGNWFRYTDKKKDFRIPYFNRMDTVAAASLPEAYVIPAEWTEVIERLKLHGIRMKKLIQPATISVTKVRFTKAKWQEKPYEGRHILRFEAVDLEQEQTLAGGSVLIDMNQETARVIAYALEPASEYSFVHWGFFDAVFEQKEYSETYVMEVIAREMLAADPLLKKEFEDKWSSDKDFAASQWEMLNWFYNRSAYRDEKMNMYPVLKITNRKEMDKLILSGD